MATIPAQPARPWLVILWLALAVLLRKAHGFPPLRWCRH